MANQDILYRWWRTHKYPTNTDITVLEISEKLLGARGQLNYRAEHATEISDPGWNYAVLKFLIEYCEITDGELSVLKEKANSKSGNYGYWNTRQTLIVQVKDKLF